MVCATSLKVLLRFLKTRVVERCENGDSAVSLSFSIKEIVEPGHLLLYYYVPTKFTVT